jgi:Ca-activated chloride channel family protein
MGAALFIMMTVVDTSGSMDGPPLAAVKEGLKIATSTINAGNSVGLVTFGDRAVCPGAFSDL